MWLVFCGCGFFLVLFFVGCWCWNILVLDGCVLVFFVCILGGYRFVVVFSVGGDDCWVGWRVGCDRFLFFLVAGVWGYSYWCVCVYVVCYDWLRVLFCLGSFFCVVVLWWCDWWCFFGWWVWVWSVDWDCFVWWWICIVYELRWCSVVWIVFV